MQFMSKRLHLIAAAFALFATVALTAQTNPTGTVSGRVVDEQKLGVPGVTVTAGSPALQGVRTAVTSENGDFVLPFLPPGEYTLTFELAGFATVRRTERVRIGETTPVSQTLTVNAVSETITVSATSPSAFTTGAQASMTVKSDLVETLPLNRTMTGAAMLAPGVQGAGPSGNMMINGAMSFESLFVVNGVVVNENLRGQPQALFIEDALQETTVKTGSVSAEYGRFQGGVVEAVTKSGGNTFHGSYRNTVENDSWTALTPYPNDSRTDKALFTHEATLGGPLVRDRLWFFGAGRAANRETMGTTSVTSLGYPIAREQQRYEGKLTWSAVTGHTLRGAYTRIEDEERGNAFLPIMDLASLVNRKTPQDLLSANYTGVIGPRFFLEGQYSRRQFTFSGSGSQFTDPIRGTLMLDQSRNNARFWSPTFCGVCGDEERDNRNVIVKANYFASTPRAGSHNVVAGVDVFDDERRANNHQSGSDFRILATSTIVRGDQVYPVFDSRTIIQWNPILQVSQGNRFRTISAFVNDAWTVGSRLTLGLGVRYDKNDGTDQSGAAVVKDAAFSPRVSASWDPVGDGAWTINGAFGRYVAGLTTTAGDSASSAGNPATFQFAYAGPDVNTGAPASPVTTDVALQRLWDWFDATGGTNRPVRGNPILPGINTRIDDGLASPSTLEYTGGIARKFGATGLFRVDAVYRDYRDFYSIRVNPQTGQVADDSGRRYDLRFTGNTNDVERTYKGLNVQAQFAPARQVTLGATYTLGELRGNFEGENGPSGPQPATFEIYPEYLSREWAFPVGSLFGDVRHKARGFLTWNVPAPAPFGRVNLGVLQTFNSGTFYGASGPVDTRPYVTNPGYATPPASVNYFFTDRDAFKTDDLWQTDLALNWSRRMGLRNTELFFRGTLLNVFGQRKLTNFFATCGTGGCINTTVQTASNNATLQPFNPFTDTPVEGVHWKKADAFGKPISRFAYQTPRTFQFSFGVKF
jgi:hypothetical protein